MSEMIKYFTQSGWNTGNNEHNYDSHREKIAAEKGFS